MQNMAAGWPSEDAVLVLQADHVDIVEIEEFSGGLIRTQVILCQRPPNPRRIGISRFRIVHGQRQQSRAPILGGDSPTQVGRESSNSTLAGKIVANDGDPAG